MLLIYTVVEKLSIAALSNNFINNDFNHLNNNKENICFCLSTGSFVFYANDTSCQLNNAAGARPPYV